MHLQLILASLHHHKLTAIMLMLQVALTCAIVCNVVFMIVGRVERISLPTGIVENELSVIRSTGIGKDENQWVQHQADLAELRTIPDVESVAAVSYSLPLNQNEDSYGVCPNKQTVERAMQAMSMKGLGCIQSSVYDGSPGLIKTLGLHLVEGRGFLPDEYVTKGKPAVVIITRAMARRLYPGQGALGKDMYVGLHIMRIVGIVDTLLRPRLRNPGVDYDSMIWPQLPNNSGVTYIMRSVPQDRQRVLQAAEKALIKVNPNRIINRDGMQTYTQIRAQYFLRDTTMIGLLIASVLGLMFVTALGISGLANFWVQQRTRSIGIRRAVGATRGDILRYFQTENFLIVTFGIVLGVVLAIAINLTLMKFYELPRLPLWYLPIGAIVLWLLGQLAVLGPALHAAAVPPITATRSG